MDTTTPLPTPEDVAAARAKAIHAFTEVFPLPPLVSRGRQAALLGRALDAVLELIDMRREAALAAVLLARGRGIQKDLQQLHAELDAGRLEPG